MTAPAPLDDAGAAGTADRPAESTGPVAVPQPTVGEFVDRARHRWRAALVERAGTSALADVDRLGEAQLDLSAAHPSGIAQLFAGRPTRLSNLVREGSAASAARRRARAVAARAEEHAQRYGLASAFLAIGVASWTEPVTDTRERADAAELLDTLAAATRPTPDDQDDDAAGAADGIEGAAPAVRTVHAPVLLRPVDVRPRGRGESDYDLELEPSLEVNSLVAAALRSRGALLDPHALARGAFTAGGFDPRPALERLRALGAAVLPDFELTERLLVGTFVHPEQVLVDDLDALGDLAARHEVVTALAGDQRSIDALAHPLPAALRGDRPLEQERGAGDLSPAQAHVLDALAAGHHLLVDAPTGSDVAGTVAAVVAEATAAGRTVLYVAGHRRAARALTDRLDELGLGDLVLDVAPDPDWRAQAGRRLLGAMTGEPVVLDAEKIAIVQSELLDRRRRLHGYMESMHQRREPWGASAYDALQALARLTSQRPGPRTTVRLTAPVAEALDAERRGQAVADLVRVAGLGAFAASSWSSPWYGADLTTPGQATTALQRIDRLLDDTLSRTEEQATRVADATGLIRAETPARWAEQLAMLGGVRDALDVFRPLVFERSAADLVAATAPPAWRVEHGIDMGRVVRRRLRRQAKDMLRPGRPVDDLHGALVEVQAQRKVWQEHCPAGGWPQIPAGLAAIEEDHRAVREDLEALSAVLSGTAIGGNLTGLTWEELRTRLARLRTDRATLDTLPERTALVRSLARRGLGDLLADLADREVSAALVGPELELAWWSTVFEEILRQDPVLGRYDGTALARLVAEFRALDTRYVADRARLARAAADDALRTRLRRADTQELFGEVIEDRFTSLRLAVERYPDVARHLRPCLVASPMLVPHLLPPARTEDLVILDAAGHLPVETVISALARGRQVMVVGDTLSASGTALGALAEVLPVVTLQADTSRRDPHLTAFLAEHGYDGRLVATPLPSTAALLRLDLVEGSGMPAANGVVESTAEEVRHVVDLVIEHALTRPTESLAVVTASAVHADAVREAVRAEVRDDLALEKFFRADQTEPFAVVEIGATQGLSREAVILSLGLGRTPHGRVLHRFGALSEPGGDGRLLEALGSTRHRLTLVSCFGADDLDEDRLRAPGARLLADLLALAGRPGGPAVGSDRPRAVGVEPDRLVLDLAERLWRRGLLVELDHGVTDARIPLVVGHPDLPDQMLVAVLTDDQDYLDEPSVRVRDRQVAERLERVGWTVVQVWSAAAFLDPVGETDAIYDAVLAAFARRTAERAALRGEGPHDAATRPADDVAGQPAGGIASAPASTGGSAPPAGVLSAEGPRPRGARPSVEPGLPSGAYTDDQLDDLARWLVSDGVRREVDALVEDLRTELGIVRRGARIDAAVRGAARRALTDAGLTEAAEPRG